MKQFRNHLFLVACLGLMSMGLYGMYGMDEYGLRKYGMGEEQTEPTSGGSYKKAYDRGLCDPTIVDGKPFWPPIIWFYLTDQTTSGAPGRLEHDLALYALNKRLEENPVPFRPDTAYGGLPAGTLYD